MAGASDDDVQDGDTTAAGIAPAASAADDEEDRTVQQPPDPKIRSAIAKELKNGPPASAPKPSPLAPQVGLGKGPAPRAPVAVPSASKPGAAPTSNVTSKKMTFVGLAPPAAGSAAAPPALTSVPMITKNGPPSAPRPASMAVKPPASNAKPPPIPPSTAAPPSSLTSPNAPVPQNEAEEEDASITATAPAPRVGAATAASTGAVPPSVPIKPPPLPLTVPGHVQIREMPPPVEEQEPLDETEVRTVVSGPIDNPAPAATKATPSTAPEADVEDDEELEDSVTTQAPSQVVGGLLPEDDADEPKTSPPMRMPPPIPAAGRSPFDSPPIPSAAAANAKKGANDGEAEDDEDAYNVEDSVTTRGPAVPDFKIPNESDNGPESSGRWPSPIGARAATMSQALGLPPKAGGLPPAIEDGTEGTTNRFAGQGPAQAAAAKKGGPPRPSPAATMASPAALNVPPKVGAAAEEEEDDPQEDNRTAVMLGAPVKPPGGPIPGARARSVGGGMATHLSAGVAARATAPVQDPGSESGLRVAPHEQQPPPEDRASVGAMMSGALMHHGATSDRGSGVAPREYPSQPLPQLAPHMMQHHFPASEPNLALGMTIPAGAGMQTPMGMGGPPTQMQQYDFAATIKKPRYGLLVGLVALLSFAIPLVLFLWLHQTVQEPLIRTPSEVASDKVRLAPPPMLSIATASASAPHPKGPPGPRRR